jgi:hypothetical protein
MPEEARSLWEQYHSEVEPWRGGRLILVTIGLCFLVSHGVVAAAQIMLGNIEQLLAFSIGCIVFWLQFYFIWIGVHWVRWLAGAWAGVNGFCWLIWGLGGSDALTVSFGAINLLIASYFCLSSSVYFFAKRQRETVRWREAVAVAVVCLLLLCSIGAGMIGLWAFRTQQLREAVEFAEVAAQQIYENADEDWALSHVTHKSLQYYDGRQRLKYFCKTPARGCVLFDRSQAHEDGFDFVSICRLALSGTLM